MQGEQETKDLMLFVSVMTAAWILAGIAASAALYYDAQGVAALITPERRDLFGRFVGIWLIGGIIMGFFTLIDFLAMAEQYGPVKAYPKHLKHISTAAIILGVLTGVVQYKLIDSAAAIARPIGWGLVLCGGIALVGSHIGVLLIGRIGRATRGGRR